MPDLIVVGGGLAGSEAAWQAAERGMQVTLYEMRPTRETGAHVTGGLAELVCSNSLGSNQLNNGGGMLKEELRLLGSMLLECAAQTALPAGGALAVDREAFSRLVTERIENHPNIRVAREEVLSVPNTPAVIASGPLTSPALTESIGALTGQGSLFFFDAIAPIVRAESINLEHAYLGSRYAMKESDGGDYINCPMNQSQYERFVSELLAAERIPLRWFEMPIEDGITAGAGGFFEGCLPVEVLARREPLSLAYGPMRPVGLRDPRTGRGSFAVVQLRQDNLAATLYNMVGFQTNLTYGEQKRIFRMIPGLERAEFERYGQMHRNTFIASPLLLEPTLAMRAYPDLFFAGQIVGVEGYMGNIATGLLAGINAARALAGQKPLRLPVTTMLGGLAHYITHAALQDFQPMKANYGILPPLENPARGKPERSMQYTVRGLKDLAAFARANGMKLKDPLSIEGQVLFEA